MTIDVGDEVPDADLIRMAEDGPETIRMRDLLAGRKVVLFGLPGAYTRTCTAAHLPSFIRTADGFRGKGVDEIICLSVNDIWVLDHWAESSGGKAAGIVFLADWNSEWTKAAGLAFTAPPVGFRERCQRSAMVIEDGRVSVLQIEESRGECTLTAGETLLEMV